jgi:hypothetical protein
VQRTHDHPSLYLMSGGVKERNCLFVCPGSVRFRGLGGALWSRVQKSCHRTQVMRYAQCSGLVYGANYGMNIFCVHRISINAILEHYS